MAPTMAPPNKKQFVSLPIDLLDEVLVRLPVKSLLRFKCVSKSWCDTISSPSFVKFHLDHVKKHQDESSSLLVLVKERSPSVWSTPCWPKGTLVNSRLYSLHLSGLNCPMDDLGFSVISSQSYFAVGSCHGLACFRSLINILLFNPSTREYKVIPLRPLYCTQDAHFTAWWSSSYCVFGHAPRSNDYKVIRIVNLIKPIVHGDNKQEKLEVQIYSLKDNLWKRASDAKCYEKMQLLSDRGWKTSQKFVQEDATYCLTAPHKPLIWSPTNTKGGIIGRFDFDDETCTEIKVPDYVGLPRLEAINNRLGLIVLRPRFIQIWILNNDRPEPWMNILNICRPGEIKRTFGGVEYPMAYLKDKILFVKDNVGSLFWFHIKKETFTDEGSREGEIWSFKSMVCTSSLVPLS